MATSVYNLPRAHPLRPRAVQIALAVLLLLFAAVSLLAVGYTAAFIPVLALFLAAAIALGVMAWPVQSVLITLVIIPLSRFISLLAYAATGSAMAVRMSQVVKDEILLALLLAVANLAFRNRTVPRLRYLDLLIAGYVAVAILYIAYPGADGAGTTTLLGKILALRQDVLWLLAYFVGRGMPLSRKTLERMMLTLIVLSAVLGLIAALQFAFPDLSNRLFRYLKFRSFMDTIGASREDVAVRSRGIAGADLPRSSSLFLSDLGLAFFQVMIIPFAAALFFYARRRPAIFGYGALLVLMIGALGMTITRTAIAVGMLGLACVLVRSSSYARALAICGITAGLGLAAVAYKGFDGLTLSALTSTQEGSALSHVALIQEALEFVRSYPFGLGLGNGSHVANALGGYKVGAVESWYLQLAVEMGVLAAILFIALLGTSVIEAVLSSFRVRDLLLRVVTVSVAGAGVSLLVLSTIHPVWASVHVAYLYWLFAGIACRAPVLEREWLASQEGQAP